MYLLGARPLFQTTPSSDAGIETVSIPGKTNYPIEELFLDQGSGNAGGSRGSGSETLPRVLGLQQERPQARRPESFLYLGPQLPCSRVQQPLARVPSSIAADLHTGSYQITAKKQAFARRRQPESSERKTCCRSCLPRASRTSHEDQASYGYQDN